MAHQIERIQANEVLDKLGVVDAHKWSDTDAKRSLIDLGKQVFYPIEAQRLTKLIEELNEDGTPAGPQRKALAAIEAKIDPELQEQLKLIADCKDSQDLLYKIGNIVNRGVGILEMVPIVLPPKKEKYKPQKNEDIQALIYELNKCNLRTVAGVNRWDELNGGNGVVINDVYHFATGARRTNTDSLDRVDYYPPDTDPFTRAQVIADYWKERANRLKDAFDAKVFEIKQMAIHRAPSAAENRELRSLREGYQAVKKIHAKAQADTVEPDKLTPEQRRQEAEQREVFAEYERRNREEFEQLCKL